jgi:hypothetical protein
LESAVYFVNEEAVLSEDMFEFIKRMCVAAESCGKWICDEMMGTLM